MGGGVVVSGGEGWLNCMNCLKNNLLRGPKKKKKSQAVFAFVQSV